MQPLIRCHSGTHVAQVAHTTRLDGDLSPSTVAPGELRERRRRALDMPWVSLRQVHSDRVLVAHRASDERPVGDGMITQTPGLALAVHSGDCVPIGLVASGGAIAVVHGGWKGLEAGVLESCVRRMRSLVGVGSIHAAVGPHIRAARYEFGAADLERLGRRFGRTVVTTDDRGAPALDLTAAVAGECARLDVELSVTSPACTADEHELYWSHRARAETGRIALVAWLDPKDAEHAG